MRPMSVHQETGQTSQLIEMTMTNEHGYFDNHYGTVASMSVHLETGQTPTYPDNDYKDNDNDDKSTQLSLF